MKGNSLKNASKKEAEFINQLRKDSQDRWTPKVDAQIHRDTVSYNRSCARTGLLHSPQTKEKISLALKGVAVRIVMCPHCAKQCGIGPMYRWHFEKCKLKQNESVSMLSK